MRLDYQRLAIFGGMVLVAGGLSACGGQATTLDTELFPIAAVIGTDASATRPLAEDRPDVAPPLLTPIPQTDENCLGCHTDVESLRDLATEAEPMEAPSSGEG